MRFAVVLKRPNSRTDNARCALSVAANPIHWKPESKTMNGTLKEIVQGYLALAFALAAAAPMVVVAYVACIH